MPAVPMNSKPASSLLMGWLAVLTTASYLVPNHFFPWISFHEEWLIALGFAPIMAWAAWRCDKIPVFAKIALVAGFVPGFQWSVGLINYRGDAIMASLYCWGFALAIIAGAQWAGKNNSQSAKNHSENSVDLLMLVPLWVALILAGIVSVGICVHQWLDLQILAVFIADLPPNGRPFANLAQPNHLASLLLLGIAGVIFLFEAKKTNGASSIFITMVLIFGLVMTQSRTVLLAAVWLLAVFLLMKDQCNLRTPTRAILSAIVAFGLLTWLWPDINRWLLVSENTDSAATRIASDARIIYFRSAMDAILQKPLMGFGFQQINLAQRATEASYHATHNYFQSAHNLLLDLMLWAGVPISLTLVYLFLKSLKTIVVNASDGVTWAILVGVGFLLVHSMFEYPLYYSYFLLPAGFLFGSMSQREKYSLEILPSFMNRIVVLPVVFFCGLIFIQITLEYPQWEREWRNARFEILKFTKTEPAAPPSPAILDPIEDLLWFVRYPIDTGMSQIDLNRAKKVANRYSHTIVFFRYSQMAALNGRSEDASYYLRLLCRFHSKSACDQARKDWTEAGMTTWPKLSGIQFPSDVLN